MKICARVRQLLIAVIAMITMILTTSSALAFPDPAEMLNDFVHYATIANVELARGNAQALLDSGIDNAKLAQLVDDGKDGPKRFDNAVAKAQLVPDLEGVVSELAKRVEMGRLDLARNEARIKEAVKMLVGAQRERMLAKKRLASASEYAVPALLKEIVEGRDEQLKLACQDVLVEIGPPAVTPLSIALLELTGVSQRTVCELLGRIKHPHATPYLRELTLSETADNQVKEAANRAFHACGGVDISLAALYANLARQYFDGHQSLIAFPTEEENNVWKYDAFVGLSPTPVATAIFSEVMAMKNAIHALRLDPRNSDAVTIFVAANLKRENDLPEGESDPIYGNLQYSPSFYATIFGTQTCLDVLALAIDKIDTPLVRDAIEALSKTTGGSNLFSRGKGRQPLLEALQYPNRRVQYEAALVLGHALPQQAFEGDHYIVPLLASAVRMGNKSLALVIAEDDENRRNAINQLEKLNFSVVGSGAGVAAVQVDVGRAVGVDFIVVRQRSAQTAKQTIESLRALPKTSAAPILVVASATDMPELRQEYRDDARVHIARAGADPDAFAASVENVMVRGAGGRMTEAEAEEYAILALSVLHDIAISRSPAYAIADAESALIDALATRTGGTRIKVAEIIAKIDSDNAQRKLFDASLAAADDEQVDLLKLTADSVRRFGDRAEKRHVDGLLDLISKATGPTAEAAATVHGSLNMADSGAVKLLPPQ